MTCLPIHEYKRQAKGLCREHTLGVKESVSASCLPRQDLWHQQLQLASLGLDHSSIPRHVLLAADSRCNGLQLTQVTCTCVRAHTAPSVLIHVALEHRAWALMWEVQKGKCREALLLGG